MNKKLSVNIFTPLGKYYSGDVDFIKVTSEVAVLGILPNHAPIITTLEICKLTLRIGDNDLNFAISGGILHIKKDKTVILLLNAIEKSNEIDFIRAEKSKIRAENRLQSHHENIDLMRAKASLNRALNRLSFKIKI